MTQRLFWPCWFLASVTSGLVAGFMLGHVLVLGRFLDWMLASDPGLLATTYPVFALSAGRAGLSVFYGICGLQVVAALALLALALAGRRNRLGAAIAALAAVLWPVIHYASGFGAVEAAALRSSSPVSPDVASSFLAWNATVHVLHSVVLLVGLTALLAMPGTLRRASAP